MRDESVLHEMAREELYCINGVWPTEEEIEVQMDEMMKFTKEELEKAREWLRKRDEKLYF